MKEMRLGSSSRLERCSDEFAGGIAIVGWVPWGGCRLCSSSMKKINMSIECGLDEQEGELGREVDQFIRPKSSDEMPSEEA